MSYFAFGISDNGDYRENNEDAFIINHTVKPIGSYQEEMEQPFFVAVCDGVGGEKSGEVASYMALELLSRLDYSSELDIKKQMMNIHEAIKKSGLEHSDFENMQTTFCGIYVDKDDYAYCVNVGDSRLYKLEDKKLTQVSTDHSLVEHLFSIGQIDESQKINHDKKNIIMPAMGNNSYEPFIDILPLGNIDHNSIYLLCTDGMSDYVTNDELEIGLGIENMPINQRIITLLELAIERGSQDNITALVLKRI